MDMASPEVIALVASASNTTPVVVETSAAVDVSLGELKIDGVLGNTAANGSFYVKGASAAGRSFELYSDAKLTKPMAGSGEYQGGGSIYRPLTDDYGIVVGINVYPALTPLLGPEADAAEFNRWLVSGTGGRVPMRNVKRILSSDYSAPDPNDRTTWQPALDALKQLFWKYWDITLRNDAKGDSRVGRRLWVFLSGHGITPVRAPDPDLDNAALLAATAAPGNYGEHFTAYSWVRWFRDAAA